MQVAGYCWRKEDIIPPGILDSESLKASLEVNTIEVATCKIRREFNQIHCKCDKYYSPFMVFWTFCSNILRLDCSSMAASLFRGSSGLGSWNKKDQDRQHIWKDLVEIREKGTHEEEVLKTIDYRVDCQHWLPVLSKVCVKISLLVSEQLWRLKVMTAFCQIVS